jgi:transcriptional regulator with XRE-family HTH domain
MQTIGERLEEARKKKGISIREAAEATKIRGDYLQKFESNQFDIGLTDIYVRGFLKNYATFLHLPADRLLGDFGALGHGEARPRQPSREVYGRMDLSVASADDRGERGSAPTAEPPPPEAARHSPHIPHAPQVPHAPRSHATGLPDSPSISPNAVYKIGIVLLSVVVLFLVIWIVSSLFGGGSARSAEHAPSQVPTVAQPVEPTFKLIALDAVQVQVTAVADGAVLFKGALQQGQVQSVPWPGSVYIQASSGANLNIEYRDRRTAMPTVVKNGIQSVSNVAKLPGPNDGQ